MDIGQSNQINLRRFSVGSIIVKELFPRQEDDCPEPESSDTSEELLPLVMVVDDDPMNIAVMEAMLFERNVKCDTAGGGTEAISLFKERIAKCKREGASMYKLILLDFSMPDMNGPAVASQIRDLYDDCSNEPFICCCTAYGDAAYIEQALQSGMNRFQTKPLKMSDLDEILLMLKLRQCSVNKK